MAAFRTDPKGRNGPERVFAMAMNSGLVSMLGCRNKGASLPTVALEPGYLEEQAGEGEVHDQDIRARRERAVEDFDALLLEGGPQGRGLPLGAPHPARSRQVDDRRIALGQTVRGPSVSSRAAVRWSRATTFTVANPLVGRRAMCRSGQWPSSTGRCRGVSSGEGRLRWDLCRRDGPPRTGCATRSG